MVKTLNEEDLRHLKRYFNRSSRKSKFINANEEKTKSELLLVKKKLNLFIIFTNAVLIPYFVFNVYFFVAGIEYPFPILDILVKTPLYSGLTAFMAVLLDFLLIYYVRQRLKPLNFMLILLNEDRNSDDLREFLIGSPFQ